MSVVLVCGGRKFKDKAWLVRTLTRLHAAHRFTTLVEGDANGVDRMAGQWAEDNGIAVDRYPVTKEDWQTWGLRAGPRRNAIMLEEGVPDLVVAFPGGKGTADMVAQAMAKGVPVIEIDEQENLL